MNALSKAAIQHLTVSRLGALVVAFLPLAVYLLTLQNGLTPGELQGGDPITHQYAQATLRFANAPGYPIFTMLGWLWFQGSAFLTPFFNPIERLTFYSTLYAIPSLVILYYLLLDCMTASGRRRTAVEDVEQSAISSQSSAVQNRWSAVSGQQSTMHLRRPSIVRRPSSAVRHLPSAVLFATLATLFFAFTYFFWYYAISSENYSSGVLLMLVMIALAWRWQERRDEATLLWLCFVCGLSLAHLLTVAIAVPAVIVFVVGQQPDYLRRPKLIAKTIIAALLPLLSYAYIYWRGAEHPEWRGQGNWPNTLAWFFDFLKTQQGQHELTWSWDGIPWPMFQLIANELTVFVFVGGLIGLALLPRWRAVLLLGSVAIYAPELYLDRYGNWFQTIIPLYAVFVIGFGALAYRTYILALSRWSARWVGSAFAVGLALLMLSKLIGNYPADNLRDRPAATGLVPGWQLLADDPARDALIAGSYEEDLALDYLTQVWGVRRDVRTLAIGKVNLALGQELYASHSAMPIVARTLPATAKLASAGLNLIALRNTPLRDLPASAQVLNQPSAQGLQLAGYRWIQTGEQQHIVLHWRATQAIHVDMAISLRLMRGADIIAQADSAHPVDGYYPMTRWSAGEVVRDDYAFAAGAAQGDHVHVIAYRKTATGFENLAEFDLPP